MAALLVASSSAAAGPGAKARKGTNAAQEVLRYGRQIQKARKELRSVDHRPLRRALSSFGQPNMAAAERRRLLSEASGAPLTDSALAMARALAGLVPRGAFERAGRASRRGMGEARSAVKGRWWGNFVPEDLSETGRALDALAAAVEKPEFRGQLDTALNVLRVAGRIEAENLSRLSGRIPEENVEAVQAALSRYAASMAAEVVDATSGGTMDQPSKAATARLVGGLLEIARTVRTTAGQPRHVRDAAIAPEVVRLRKDLQLASRQMRGTIDRVAASGSLEAVNWRRLTRRVAVHNRRLQRTLSASLDMSPEAREAATALSKDAELTGRFALGTARIIGAAQNTDMKPRERAAVVKEAAESMGPIFIKMVQTIINKTGSLEEFGLGRSPDDAVILVALSELQDKVTPMPERVLRAQVRKSLGGKEIEEAFAEFDMTPIKSASIAQVHRARVWVRRAPFFKKQLVEVAVKVQRPNLEADMKDAVRAARLAMAVTRESLRAFDVADRIKIDPVKIGRGLDLVDNTLADFIRSFAIETDFKTERKHMRRMARLVRNERDIYVPKVHEKHSGELVITMDFVRGDKLYEPPRPTFEGEEPEPVEETYVSRAGRAQ
ncbi:MAG TPA: AarF/UbiB family protein, partial [Kofleriaceae bacterium]|nr:AarF/UbiB family protein [Kofleriaceae bacterium]